MDNAVRKTLKIAKPRKTATTKVNVAKAAGATAKEHEGIALVAKEDKVKAVTSKPRKAAGNDLEVTNIAATPLREAIEYRAYCYWTERGFQDGSALQDWLRAERELLRAS
jgi:hypothetical protein